MASNEPQVLIPEQKYLCGPNYDAGEYREGRDLAYPKDINRVFSKTAMTIQDASQCQCNEEHDLLYPNNNNNGDNNGDIFSKHASTTQVTDTKFDDGHDEHHGHVDKNPKVAALQGMLEGHDAVHESETATGGPVQKVKYISDESHEQDYKSTKATAGQAQKLDSVSALATAQDSASMEHHQSAVATLPPFDFIEEIRSVVTSPSAPFAPPGAVYNQATSGLARPVESLPTKTDQGCPPLNEVHAVCLQGPEFPPSVAADVIAAILRISAVNGPHDIVPTIRGVTNQHVPAFSRMSLSDRINYYDAAVQTCMTLLQRHYSSHVPATLGVIQPKHLSRLALETKVGFVIMGRCPKTDDRGNGFMHEPTCKTTIAMHEFLRVYKAKLDENDNIIPLYCDCIPVCNVALGFPIQTKPGVVKSKQETDRDNTFYIIMYGVTKLLLDLVLMLGFNLKSALLLGVPTWRCRNDVIDGQKIRLHQAPHPAARDDPSKGKYIGRELANAIAHVLHFHFGCKNLTQDFAFHKHAIDVVNRKLRQHSEIAFKNP